jgi:hypothetical protein
MPVVPECVYRCLEVRVFDNAGAGSTVELFDRLQVVSNNTAEILQVESRYISDGRDTVYYEVCFYCLFL